MVIIDLVEHHTNTRSGCTNCIPLVRWMDRWHSSNKSKSWLFTVITISSFGGFIKCWGWSCISWLGKPSFLFILQAPQGASQVRICNGYWTFWKLRCPGFQDDVMQVICCMSTQHVPMKHMDGAFKLSCLILLLLSNSSYLGKWAHKLYWVSKLTFTGRQINFSQSKNNVWLRR